MANRLTGIVTRTGDDGTTGLADGTRRVKDHARISALGSVDELNSHLGLLRTEAVSHRIQATLLNLQHQLFDLGAALAVPGSPFNVEKLHALDGEIANYQHGLMPLREFILPGGCRAAAQCHLARSVARRAERDYVSLMQVETVSADGLRYLNRLSDLLFVLCRVLNAEAGQGDIFWQVRS